MSDTYLPGDTRQRIQDLIKGRKITQAEPAEKVGLSNSALSLYLQGNTKNLGDGFIIRIAKYFDVSTDFLLGETDIPDRKNYDVEALGLTPEAVCRMASGMIDMETVNRLLANRLFPAAAKCIAAYINGDIEEGIGVQNDIMNLAINGLKGYPEAQAAAMNHALLSRILQNIWPKRLLEELMSLFRNYGICWTGIQSFRPKASG